MEKQEASKYVKPVVEALLFSGEGVVRAVKYLAPNLIVRAVRTRYAGKISKTGNIEMSVTIGRPNFLEREFVVLCKKAKEPFPVAKIQLKLQTIRKKK